VPVVDQDNWRVDWRLTERKGLVLRTCGYKGARVLRGASVPFVYVRYEGSDIGMFTDALASESGTVEVRQVFRGFDLHARYDAFGEDYLYEHIWRFHDDGQLGSRIVIHGPGEEIGGAHHYHVPFRLDLDVSGSESDSLQRRLPSDSGGSWVDVSREGVLPAAAGDGPDWQVLDRATGRSAAIAADPGDDAELWGLRYRAEEAAAAIGGVQAQPPGSAGGVPAMFAGDESVQDADLVLWYLAVRPSTPAVAACGPWITLHGY
jgi:hypothetical protein